MKNIVIIGAGPAGLTTAYELLKRNKKYNVIILEESNNIGGLSKTIVYKDNRMDIGGHRFFSKEKRVNEFWEEIMPLQGENSYDDKLLNNDKPIKKGGPDPEKENNVMLVRNRVSRIYYLKKFFNYPVNLKIDTIKNLGIKNTLKSGFSYFKSIIFKRKENNLEDFYINRFGKKLYNTFFENYTEKLWGRHPKEISAEWGNQRVKGLSILEVIKNRFKKNKKKETSLIEEYYYPKYGPGSLWEEVANRIEKLGGKIILNQKVIKINQKKGKIVSLNTRDKEYKADIFISSMPLKDLVTNMNNVPNEINQIAYGLPYRDFITVGVLVKKLKVKNETKIKTLNNIIPDCWIYVQEPDVKLGRIQIFNNWSPYIVKDTKNTVWIGLEYFCNENDELWNMSEKKFTKFAIDELVKIGIIDKKDVLDAHQEKIKKAYPAYFDTYKDIDKVINYLDKFDNLYCIGRNGQHHYNNMDHSMLTAFETVDNIVKDKKDKQDIWKVNTEQEYHEEVKKEKKKFKTSNIMFILFVLFSLIVSLCHEPWRDEAQSFLLSKLNIVDLFNQLKVEGHPILWYLILKITNNSYNFIWILPWLITTVTSSLIVYKMNKPLINKIVILLSLPILFVSSAFARSYSLAVLLIVLLALIYKKRYSYPLLYGILLILLMNTHIIFIGFLCSLILVDIYNFIKDKDDRKNIIKIIVLFIFGLLFLLVQLYGSTNSRSELFIGNMLFSKNYLDIFINMILNITKDIYLTYIFIFCLICLIIYLIKQKELKLLTILIISFIGFLGIMAIYNGRYYMHSMLLMIFLFIYWQIENRKIINIIMGILFICTIFNTFIIISLDLKGYYSPSKVTAEYIKNNIDKNEIIYCLNASYCSSLIPYNMEYQFIDIISNEKFTYVDWSNYKEDINDYDLNNDQISYIKYLIVPHNKEKQYEEYYNIIYKSPSGIIDENYIILERK